MLASLGGQRGPVPYADDDPLTSPSFPAIQDDSRSYRNGRGRGASAPHRSPVSPAAPTQQMAAYPQAPGQFDGYGPGAPGNAAEPAGYRRQARLPSPRARSRTRPRRPRRQRRPGTRATTARPTATPTAVT